MRKPAPSKILLGVFLLLAPAFTAAQGSITILHPLEGAKLPALNEIFVYGSVTPGSTFTINGFPIPVHEDGGYLVILPLKAGDNILSAEAILGDSDTVKLERRFTVAEPPLSLPSRPTRIEKTLMEPKEDVALQPGDWVRVAFVGSPGGQAEFDITEVTRHIPMVEVQPSSPAVIAGTQTWTARGLYEGHYQIQAGDMGKQRPIEISLKNGKEILREKTPGRLTIDRDPFPRTAVVIEDQTAVRTGPGAGYDLFLYKGMRVRSTGKIGAERRVALSSIQSGWVKDSALQDLPPGLGAPRSLLTNITTVRGEDSTILRMSLQEALPYRVEQLIEPMQLVITLYGAVHKADLVRFDPQDPLIRQIRWRQIAPDTFQLLIHPAFPRWWGFDVRYEGNVLVVEIRKPWTADNVKGMVIAVDPGHGGSDKGAMGPLENLEKAANLAIAEKVVEALTNAGAKPFLTRDKDMDVALYDRPRLAWNMRAHLFVSVHCNSAGLWENPLKTNGYSVYYYQPQSAALAQAVHAQYGEKTNLPDRGLFYADFAVCRMTQMPAILTENAYIIVPEQEKLLFSPKFQKAAANAILGGIRKFLNPAQ